jgi:hypothetical protein
MLVMTGNTSGLNSVGLWVTVYAVGPCTVFLLVMTYLVAPEFYLTWVLEKGNREFQLVEILTFVSAFTAGILLLIWIWRARSYVGHGYWKGIAGVGIIAAATLFFAGEEISWGQTFIGWETPQLYSDISPSTNLHNSKLPFHLVAGVFFLIFFFLVPLVWSQRARISWGDWPKLESMVAEGPVLATLVAALVWAETKGLYTFLHDDYREQITYLQFFHQTNEHKELIIALGLFIYSVLRFRHRFPAA